MDTQVNQILFPGDTVLSYIALAGATCMFYDHLTTLDIEIELIWNRPKWQIPQVLFLINRYVGLALQFYVASFFIKNFFGDSAERFKSAGHDSGHAFNNITGILGAVVLFAMHGIMIYRVSSMYTHDQKILRILIAVYAIECLAIPLIQLVEWLEGSNNSNAVSDVLVQAPVGFCGKEVFTKWLFVVWIPIVLFELVICGLALALGIKYYLAIGNGRMFSDYRNSNRKTSLLYILLRDSIVFPIIFAFFGILNLVIFFLAPNRLRTRHDIVHITMLFPGLLSVIFGSRLILNLRESFYEPHDQEFSIHMDTITDPESNQTTFHLPILIPSPNLSASFTVQS